MKKSILAVLVVYQSLFAGIQITENTASRLTFTWEMDSLTILDSAKTGAIISFGNQNVDLGDSGEPALPGYTFYAGVPPQGTINVQWSPLSTKTVVLSHAVRTRKDTKYVQRFPDITFAGQWLSQPRSIRFGNLHADKFILRPVIYNAQTRTLQILTRGSCTIEFPAYSGIAGYVAGGATYKAMLSDLLLNYTVAQKWVTSQAASKRLLSQTFPLAPGNTLATFSIGDGHDSINEATTKENGIIKVPGDTLIHYFGSGISWSRVACYGSYVGEMPQSAPAIESLPDGVSEIPVVRVDVNGNGTVDAGDYALIYVSGSSDWMDTTTNNVHKYMFRLNRYEDYRHYWLMLKQSGSAATMTAMPHTTASPSKTLTSFQNHMLYKNPQQLTTANDNESGLDWIWTKLSASIPSFQYYIQFPGIDTTKNVWIRALSGATSSSMTLKAQLNGTALDTDFQFSTWYSGHSSDEPLFKIIGSNFASSSYAELASIEFAYTQKLDMSQTKSMTVFSPETSAIVKYSVSNIPAEQVIIVRIASDNQISLVDTINGSTTSTYSWVDSAGAGVRYYLAAQSAYQVLPLMKTMSLSSGNHMIHDLRNSAAPTANGSDYLIITHPDFITQAQRLADHKINIGKFNSPKIVDVNDIYREFSGGNFDPAAIRNFLVYVRANWGTCPDYVVLMGKGTYNYKRIKMSDNNYIPAPEFGAWCYENFYTCLDANENITNSSATPDMIMGRLPCASLTGATQMVDKIVQMEDSASASFGGWRNRVVLVNDDDMQGDVVDDLRIDHLRSSELMGKTITGLRLAIDIHKINEYEYEWNSVKEKPEARAALINEMNNGAAVVNYFGHGSSSQWSDERILTTDMVGTLTNKKQYPLVGSFSCGVGHFDKPGTCLSEAFVLASQCGGIASIACTREAYPNENEALASAFYAALFATSGNGETFGVAYTKAQVLVADNYQKSYSYLGDPSISPAYPNRKIIVKALSSAGDSLDTIKALQAITIRGTVMKSDGTGVDVSYGSASSPASVVVCLFNPPVNNATRKDGNTVSGYNPVYSLPGTLLFSGQVSVVNGIFEQSLHIPKRVTYDSAGAKITAFAWTGFTNAIGYKSVVFHGTDSSSKSIDTVGPDMTIKPVYEQTSSSATSVTASRTDGITTSLPFQLEIDLTDSNGIDVSGTGPDEGLTIEIPGTLSKRNINTKFQFSGGDYRKGAATFDFSENFIPTGTYTLKLSAQDLGGNITKKTYSLEIVKEKALTLTHVFNFPNPMKMGQTTAFYFDVSRTTQITGTIKIYSLSGNLLRVMYNVRSGQVFDGRDQTGNLLSPQVYLYQVIVDDNSGQVSQIKSGIQKLVVHPPR